MNDPGTAWENLGLRQQVGGLPVEVVVRHGKKDLFRSIRVERAELGRLAPVVRMRQQGVDQYVLLECAFGGFGVVLCVRRDLDLAVDQRGRTQTVLRRLVIEIDAEPRRVGHGLAVGRVVHLEDDERPRR